MADIAEFRTAKIKLGDDYLPFVVEASLAQEWERLTFPVYLDQPARRSVPTLKTIMVQVRKKYESYSPLHAAIDGSPLTLEFVAGGETYEFSGARVIEWKITGQTGGEMLEHVTIECEEAE